jgi:hypothetical protein
MSVPGIVHSTLDGEEVVARVSLGSDDELFVTPSRTIVYRADGLLSDESADEFPHDADRVTISEGRRKTTFALEYALDGTRECTVPSSKTDDVLHPVLAGVLNGNEITEPGETVVKTYRFSELTLIITSDRLVKHIGGAVWDEDYEEYHFDDVTNLDFEDGSVAVQIVLTVAGRPQRIKAPNEEANDLRERLKRALFEYHGVGSLEELNEAVGERDDDGDGDDSMDFGGGVDPLDADPPETDERGAAGGTADAGRAGSSDPLAGGESGDATAAESNATESGGTEGRSSAGGASATATRRDGTAETAETGSLFEAADEGSAADDTSTATDPELLERIEALEEAVERQSDRIERQQRTIERLIEELRQGR